MQSAPISLENLKQKTSTRVDAKNGISKMFADVLPDRLIPVVVHLQVEALVRNNFFVSVFPKWFFSPESPFDIEVRFPIHF